MQLYIDSDGVMADFDEAAHQILGMNPRRFEYVNGAAAFWEKLTRNASGTPNGFFAHLALMYDAMELYEAVKHLDPIILTGAPKEVPEAEADKRSWYKHMLGEGQKVIVCPSKDKKLYCKPGDIIIDDWPKHKHLWEEVGGIWVDHRSTKYTLEALQKLGVL